jgi:hypothetical protein
VANYVGIYLNNHLAGSTVGRELSKRIAGENRGTPLGDFMKKLHLEIVEDRQTLLDVMKALDVGEDRVKEVGALIGERFGRLLPNGHLFSYSPMSRVVELEGLSLGVDGKAGLWRALQELDDPRAAGFDFVALEQRAQRQRMELEEHRVAAARLAFEQSD